MKVQIIVIAALMSLIQAQSTTPAPGGVNPAHGQIHNKMMQLKADIAAKADDKTLIADAESVLSSKKTWLQNAPADVQAQTAAIIRTIETKIQTMKTNNKFDPSIVEDFHTVGKTVQNSRAAAGASRPAAKQN